ncbi:MAG: DNA cytosine methyltransferase [Acidobacteria bacterium]|nr:DNA cytosine methyltransferase [Acidobacteriota bacterium]
MRPLGRCPSAQGRAGTAMWLVDLFAGAGLLSYAFRTRGFEISMAVESDARAASTYRRNLGNHVICADVRRIAPRGHCDVLVGGPPCQGFSTLGKRHPADPRNQLALEFVRWAAALQPRCVVVENVEPFVRAPVWRRMATGLRDLGYTVTTYSLNAADFGAAQRRHRSFTIASTTPHISIRPQPEYRQRTVREAWAGLPATPDGSNWHYSPLPSLVARNRMRLIPPGGSKRDLMNIAPELCPPSWWRRRVELTDVWGRLRWDKPSNTVRTCCNNASKGRYIHPEQDRVISLREAARLQSIPDEFAFDGYPIDVARQIGNGVPPAVGCAVAAGVAAALSR